MQTCFNNTFQAIKNRKGYNKCYKCKENVVFPYMLHVLLHIEFGVPYSDHLTILSHLHLSVNKKIMFTIFNIVYSENKSINVHLYSRKKSKLLNA